MRVSLVSLATAVAEERGISTISSIGLEDFEVVGMSMNGSAGELCKKRSARQSTKATIRDVANGAPREWVMESIPSSSFSGKREPFSSSLKQEKSGSTK